MRIASLFVIFALSGVAHAAPEDADVGLTAGLSVGGGFGLGELGAGFVPRLEVGVLLPPVDRMFEIVASLDWSAPSADGRVTDDARLAGEASWTATHQALGLGLGVRARIPLEGRFRPNLAAGVRFHFYETETEGAVGDAPFGTNAVQGTEVGFTLTLGGELYVGPGALLLDVVFVVVPLDDLVFADTSSTAIDALIGYRLFF